MGHENWFRLLFFPIFCFLFNYLLFKFNKPKNLPPGPRALPIRGHLHLFKPPIHRTLQDLSLKYGPVMFLQLGKRRVVVVCSAEAVQECFTKNDIVFANRPQLLAGKLLSFNYRTIPSTSYGDHWRNLRRLATVELLSLNRLLIKVVIQVIHISRRPHCQDFPDDCYPLQSLIIAGTDTSASTVEWAMALFLNHPEANKKVLAEIESCVGHERLLDENDPAQKRALGGPLQTSSNHDTFVIPIVKGVSRVL